MQLRQLFDKDSSTYSYLLWDEVTREAVMIDPVLEQSERDIRLIAELGLNLRYALETHIHADHITGGGLLRERFGCQVGVHENAAATCADIALKEGDQLRFGESSLTVLHTPGHTKGSIAYIWDGKVAFVGDTIMSGPKGVRTLPSLMMENLDQTYASMRKLAAFDFSVMADGHIGLTLEASKKLKDFNLSMRSQP